MDEKSLANKMAAFRNIMKSSVMIQQRKTNFTQRELNTLLNSVAKRRRTILSGASAGQDRWIAAWREVACEVSAVEGIGRTDADVRKKWTYLKWEAKNTSKPYRDVTSRAVLNILTKGNIHGYNSRNSSLFVDNLNASQHQLTPVPSTSGVVPKPSAVTAPSQPSAKPYVSVQSDVRPSPPVVPKPLSVPEPEPLPHAEDDSSISVKWNTYATNMSSVMPSLLEDEKFVDVTLACDGKYIKCHKVILGACSAYFEELLSANPCQHPIILMRDFQFWEIQAIVDFIYRGVVNIQQHKLPKLLQVASILQIKGLTGATSDTGSNPDDSKPFGSNPDDSKPTQHSRKSQLEGSGAMRKRPEFPPGPGIKTSESPVKKMKLIRISSGKPLEPNMSDESSSQSDGHSTSLSHSSEPYSLLHSVSIKEESLDYDVDDPSHNPYSYDENVVESGGTSKLGQFQLLTLPESGAIKEETSDELFNPTYEDPLEPESGVS